MSGISMPLPQDSVGYSNCRSPQIHDDGEMDFRLEVESPFSEELMSCDIAQPLSEPAAGFHCLSISTGPCPPPPSSFLFLLPPLSPPSYSSPSSSCSLLPLPLVWFFNWWFDSVSWSICDNDATQVSTLDIFLEDFKTCPYMWMTIPMNSEF